MGNLQSVGRDVPSERTLNERLNEASENIEIQLGRIDQMLSRVNGTPSTGMSGQVNTPKAIFGMGEIVTRIEEQAKRLGSHAQGIDRIA